ncbi:MAG: hypothetical protein R3C03_09420 [Pirellulaceae bacterium]
MGCCLLAFSIGHCHRNDLSDRDPNSNLNHLEKVEHKHVHSHTKFNSHDHSHQGLSITSHSHQHVHLIEHSHISTTQVGDDWHEIGHLHSSDSDAIVRYWLVEIPAENGFAFEFRRDLGGKSQVCDSGNDKIHAVLETDNKEMSSIEFVRQFNTYSAELKTDPNSLFKPVLHFKDIELDGTSFSFELDVD